MVWNRRVALRGGVVPDLVATGGLTVKFEAQGLQPLDDLPKSVAGEPAHQAPTIKG